MASAILGNPRASLLRSESWYSWIFLKTVVSKKPPLLLGGLVLNKNLVAKMEQKKFLKLAKIFLVRNKWKNLLLF
jgi:hypothetical protein